MSYANENKENSNFFLITCIESHLLNYFFKKIQIEREQYPVRKKGQLSPE